MIRITAEAARQIQNAAAGGDAEKLALRIAAKRASDGSIEYGMGFDAERKNDLQLITEGVTVLVSPHSKELLQGTVLDFVELEPGDFQFIFINPNEPGTPQPESAAARGQD